MTVRYQIEHVSRYTYTADAEQCVMLLCLEPRQDRRQRLIDFEIETQPPAHLNCETDCFGNTRHLLDLHQTHQILTITTRCTVETVAAPPLPGRLPPGAWQKIGARRKSGTDWEFAHPSALVRPSPALAAFVERHRIAPTDDPLESLLHLSHTLHNCLHYLPGSTAAESPVEHILKTERGVCQDYAHVMIAIARSWHISARYVSGYLHTAEQSVNATHAWVECHLPKLGWVGFDPTNQSVADTDVVRIAVGRDYRDVSPTRGILHGGGTTRLDVAVRMRLCS